MNIVYNFTITNNTKQQCEVKNKVNLPSATWTGSDRATFHPSGTQLVDNDGGSADFSDTATSSSVTGIDGTFDVQFATETFTCKFKFHKGSMPTFAISEGTHIHSNSPTPEIAGTTANINLTFNE